MKIAIVVNELNIRGGTHKQVLRLCEYLRSQNVDFVLCTKIYEKEKTYPEFQEFKVISLENCDVKCKKHVYIKNTIIEKKLYKLIPKDVDIVNVHDCGLNNIIYLAKKDNKKVVWQINDLPTEFFVGVSKNADLTWKMKIVRFITIFLTRRVDAITVNVSKNKDRVREKLGKDAKVFYCGVDQNKMLEFHSFASGKIEFNLLSMGVFLTYRNYETLISVIRYLKNQGKEVRLDIIGSTAINPEYAHKIQELINNNGLDDSIKIWGQVNEETYARLFNKADAFVFVNIDQSWGLAVFEAMSCGLPTIVSNSVGAIELLHNGLDSIIVEPTNVKEIASSIDRLMNDRDYYNMLSENAIRATREYTWDKMYSSKMLSLFEEL